MIEWSPKGHSSAGLLPAPTSNSSNAVARKVPSARNRQSREIIAIDTAYVAAIADSVSPASRRLIASAR